MKMLRRQLEDFERHRCTYQVVLTCSPTPVLCANLVQEFLIQVICQIQNIEK